MVILYMCYGEMLPARPRPHAYVLSTRTVEVSRLEYRLRCDWRRGGSSAREQPWLHLPSLARKPRSRFFPQCLPFVTPTLFLPPTSTPPRDHRLLHLLLYHLLPPDHQFILEEASNSSTQSDRVPDAHFTLPGTSEHTIFGLQVVAGP